MADTLRNGIQVSPVATRTQKVPSVLTLTDVSSKPRSPEKFI